MEDLINKAYKALAKTDFEEFHAAAEKENIGTLVRIAKNNLDDALDSLKANAIEDHCDPVITTHYKESHNLVVEIRKYLDNDTRG